MIDGAGKVWQTAYDAEGWKIAEISPLGHTIRYERDQVGNITEITEVSSPGYAYDARGRQIASPKDSFAWDGAGRLIGTGTASLEYNGLGNLIRRTEGLATTHYYYNYAIALNPIMAEQEEGTGQFLRYYVWTPDGTLLYMIDASAGNKVSFY